MAKKDMAPEMDMEEMPDMGMEDPGMESPKMEMGESKEMGMEVCVPLSSLSMPGEDDKMQAPGVGDPVQFQAEGKVSRVEGENAYVSVEAINGKPVDEESSMTKNTPGMAGEKEDADFAQLRSEASNQKMY